MRLTRTGKLQSESKTKIQNVQEAQFMLGTGRVKTRRFLKNCTFIIKKAGRILVVQNQAGRQGQNRADKQTIITWFS